MEAFVKIRSAILSVSDKNGIVPLAQGLIAHGVRIISTGGTKAELTKANVPVTDISVVTGNPEAFGGRMKTLSFQIASGILFDRSRDQEEAAGLKIDPIDLVVVNLYPFAEYKDQGLPLESLIEYIDIGGPTMIRAAAKNYAHVAVLTSPDQYPEFLEDLARNEGRVSVAARKRWMQAAFSRTAAYDAMIADHLSAQPLRYGENPHQSARFVPSAEGIQFETLGGKELSYNNLVDLDAALDAALSLSGPACAVVKHENPCGLAEAQTIGESLALAWAGDPVSAFGSVIALNRPVSRADVAFFGLDTSEKKFVEIVAAPRFDDEALAYLRLNKNLRILKVQTKIGDKKANRVRHLQTGTLVQSPDDRLAEGFKVASTAQPEKLDQALAEFGLHAARCLKSNAIAIVRRTTAGASLLGMGAGQPNRVKSTELALTQARENLLREAKATGARDTEAYVRTELGLCYLASDAFFPFRDSVDAALAAGVRLILQPGGSIRDAEVIAACNERNAVLIMTGIRHFKH
jgi:phosphoribosylaminoimidazolecarboxamide formyltransferase / IMP cyclohydrolase